MALSDRFINVIRDENGQAVKLDFCYKDDFNFAFDVVDELGRTQPDKLAMLWVSIDNETRHFTFKDIMEQSAKAANYFKSIGIKKGDKVMLTLKRHYQFWYAVVALHKIGAIVVPATYLLTEKDFVYRLNAANIKAIVATAIGEVGDEIEKASEKVEVKPILITANGKRDGWLNFDEGIEDCCPFFEKPTGEEAIFASDTMIMYFTSGTTGYPKIVVHSYSYPLGHFATAKLWQQVNTDGMHFTISDTGWAKSVWGKLYGQWLCEAAILTYDFEKFVADDILKKFAEYKITTFCAPPTMYRFFIKEDLTKYDLSSLERCVIAGEALNPEVYAQFLSATGLKLYEGFGQTEMTITLANFGDMEPKPGSMGKPIPQYDVDLLTLDGKIAKLGEIGEIVMRTDIKSPGMFEGYYDNEEGTKSVWYDNIYHTGDLAWQDEDGYYWYVGRTDDVIKSSGYRIGPFEVESVIMELPYVLECAVVGVPDDTRGQVVKAIIVPTVGTVSTEELKKDVQKYVKEHTAPYKYPRIVEFVESLPKTISGKIRRVELRDK